MKLIYDKSVPGRRTIRAVDTQGEPKAHIPDELRRSKSAELPEVSELDVVRHFTGLAEKNFGVDDGFYPLGSCTMKYNPKSTERISHYPGFAYLHPLLPQLPGGEMLVQGALEVLHDMDVYLSEIAGMAAFTLQPLAGAHGELTGAMIMAAYHRDRGNKKTTILIPDTAHGTNPSSAAIAGFDVKTIPSDDQGVMDFDALKAEVNETTAGVMLTSPNTLGLFNPRIKEIADLIHSVDGLMYYDGANLNAVLGKVRPGDIGFDIVHFNLHKTFATPHGGGGPGSGPVGVVERLVDYLPVSVIQVLEDGTYELEYERPKSIGYIAPFYGNFSIVLRAYAYILLLGREGMKRVSENAVLNANYLMTKLKEDFDLPYDRTCMHEFVLSASRQVNQSGVRALNIAKSLIDRRIHPMTVYFPLSVEEAMMIEPTETESKQTLDEFIEAMRDIARTVESDPESLKSAPHHTPVGMLDETKAARKPNVASLPE